MALAYRPLTQALGTAAYHAGQLVLALDRIDPDDATDICAPENLPIAQDLATLLDSITEHPAVEFLP
jgi:hypothetical protein